MLAWKKIKEITGGLSAQQEAPQITCTRLTDNDLSSSDDQACPYLRVFY